MMEKNRLEAFSDGVLAIIITIMVLELKVPQSANLESLRHLIDIFISYVLSFIYVGIYWNNHHHLLHTVKRVSGSILWANLHLLFWLSLLPFVTSWVGETHFSTIPMAFYGVVMLMSGSAYWILQVAIIAKQGEDSLLKKAVGIDIKGKMSVVLYSLSIPLCFHKPWMAGFIYVFVALMWFIPDRRIERVVSDEKK